MNDDVQATVARLRAYEAQGKEKIRRGEADYWVKVPPSDITAIFDALDAERAALVQAEGERDEAVQHYQEVGAFWNAAERERDAAAANEAALRVAADTLFDAIAHGDEAHREWLKAAIDNHFDATPPSAAAERVQRVVAAARRATSNIDRYAAGLPAPLVQAGMNLRAALDGGKEGA